MAAEWLRSEFLCSLTGLVASPRDIGTTPRGTRRFYPAIGGSFEGPRLRGEVLPDGGDWPLLRPMVFWSRMSELPSKPTTTHSSTFDTPGCGMDRLK